MMPCSCAASSASAICFAIRSASSRDRASSKPRRESSLDQFHHEGGRAPALFEAVDGGDVWLVQRAEDLGFTLEAREPIGIVSERLGQRLDGDVPSSFVSRARYTCPIPPSPTLAITSYDAEANAGGEGQTRWIIRGERGCSSVY